ncbi:hypothetical protein NGRA_1882 [Nosema granulosis]|uniref:Uncharacterized protein n=1 Tax=Nosema granulosis TaxID=83296 RepID=A0A9P6GXN6_9MICR|nr:hypothetical protein NGRA_1882 [Nosema granulosis]
MNFLLIVLLKLVLSSDDVWSDIEELIKDDSVIDTNEEKCNFLNKIENYFTNKDQNRVLEEELKRFDQVLADIRRSKQVSTLTSDSTFENNEEEIRRIEKELKEFDKVLDNVCESKTKRGILHKVRNNSISSKKFNFDDFENRWQTIDLKEKNEIIKTISTQYYTKKNLHSMRLKGEKIANAISTILEGINQFFYTDDNAMELESEDSIIDRVKNLEKLHITISSTTDNEFDLNDNMNLVSLVGDRVFDRKKTVCGLFGSASWYTRNIPIDDIITTLLYEIKKNKADLIELKSIILIVFYFYKQQNDNLSILISKIIFLIKLANTKLETEIKQEDLIDRINYLIMKSISIFFYSTHSRDFVARFEKYREEIKRVEKRVEKKEYMDLFKNILFIHYMCGKKSKTYKIFVEKILKDKIIETSRPLTENLGKGVTLLFEIVDNLIKNIYIDHEIN